MRGLIKKDCYVMKDFKKVLLIMILMVVFFLAMEPTNVSFVLGYMTILSGVLVINVMSIDEQQNVNAFLFTLPVSRKEYVVEKYGLGMIMGIIGCGISVICVIVFSMVKQMPVDWAVLLGQAVCIIGVLFVILGFGIPVQIKFGGEKGRIILIVGVMGIALEWIGIAKIMQQFRRVHKKYRTDIKSGVDMDCGSSCCTGIFCGFFFLQPPSYEKERILKTAIKRIRT